MPPGLAYGSAWLASIAVLAAPFPGAELGDFSRAAAVALPWILLAGVPLREPRGGQPITARSGAPATALHWVAGALAPLLVGARLDQLDGLGLGVLAVILVAGLAAIAGLALGAARAQGDPRQAWCWSFCVLLPPVLYAACTLLSTEHAPSAVWPLVAGVSPVTWVWKVAGAPDQALHFGWLVPPLVTIAIVGGYFRRREPGYGPRTTP